MPPLHAEIARRLAARLTALDGNLPALVEEAIEAEAPLDARRTVDDVSAAALAAVVLICAQFIHYATRERRLSVDEIERQLPVVIPGLRDMLPAERAEVVGEVVQEARGILAASGG